MKEGPEGPSGFELKAGVATNNADEFTRSPNYNVIPIRCRHGAPARSCQRCLWLRAVQRTREHDPETSRLYALHVERMRAAGWCA